MPCCCLQSAGTKLGGAHKSSGSRSVLLPHLDACRACLLQGLLLQCHSQLCLLTLRQQRSLQSGSTRNTMRCTSVLAASVAVTSASIVAARQLCTSNLILAPLLQSASQLNTALCSYGITTQHIHKSFGMQPHLRKLSPHLQRLEPC
jgi:hypothetical protein